MYQSDTEILFPMRVAPHLRDLRGGLWRATVDQACGSQNASLERLALMLVMIRLAGCLTCHPDSYRAIRGCTTCATATIRRFRGEDEELEEQIKAAQEEKGLFLPNRPEISMSFTEDYLRDKLNNEREILILNINTRLIY